MKQQPTFIARLTAALPSEPASPRRKFRVKVIQKFDNRVPGAEWNFVYGGKK